MPRIDHAASAVLLAASILCAAPAVAQVTTDKPPAAPTETAPPKEGGGPPRAYLLAAPGTKVIANEVYAKVGDLELKIDLFLPPESLAEAGKPAPPPVPIILWIHGGGWSAGSKDRAPSPAFTRRGYAGASVQYRLSGVAPFPAQIHDCKGAIRFLRANAAKYNIDPDRIGVWGASAGGHLAALLGTSAGNKDLEGDVGGNAAQSSAVQAVCDWFGPTDMPALMPANIGDRERPAAAAAGARMLVQFMGCPLTSCEEKWKLASPVTHVNKGDAPTLIMHGDKDPLVPLAQSTKLLEQLTAAGVPASLHVVQGAGHGFTGEEHLKRVAEFFDRELKPKPTDTPAAKAPTDAVAPGKP